MSAHTRRRTYNLGMCSNQSTAYVIVYVESESQQIHARGSFLDANVEDRVHWETRGGNLRKHDKPRVSVHVEESIARGTLSNSDPSKERQREGCDAQHMREKAVLADQMNRHKMPTYLSHTLTTTKAPVELKVHTASKKTVLLMALLRLRVQGSCRRRGRHRTHTAVQNCGNAVSTKLHIPVHQTR